MAWPATPSAVDEVMIGTIQSFGSEGDPANYDLGYAAGEAAGYTDGYAVGFADGGGGGGGVPTTGQTWPRGNP